MNSLILCPQQVCGQDETDQQTRSSCQKSQVCGQDETEVRVGKMMIDCVCESRAANRVASVAEVRQRHEGGPGETKEARATLRRPGRNESGRKPGVSRRRTGGSQASAGGAHVLA